MQDFLPFLFHLDTESGCTLGGRTCVLGSAVISYTNTNTDSNTNTNTITDTNTNTDAEILLINIYSHHVVDGYTKESKSQETTKNP